MRMDAPVGGITEGSRRYDAVLLDMGYTLVYFQPTTEEIIHRALQAIGVERSPHEIYVAEEAAYADETRDAASATFPATLEYDRESQRAFERNLLTRLRVPAEPATLKAFATELRSWYERPGVMHTYPEVVPILATLRQLGYRLAIVSNWSWNLRQRVVQVGLEHFFEVIWASAYAGCSKPHPAIFHQTLAQMQPAPPPGRALYVGDSYFHDVVGARSAGIAAALLDRDGRADHPDCPVIRDLGGILALLGE
ncbi:MAG TPA: HAD family hydrolase [Anaerolineae bacterium]|nr:HAD family hydrolase [Anaerolineae bacterium]